MGIVVRRAQRGFQMRAGLIQRGERGVDRLHHRLDQRRRLGGAALEPPDSSRERRHRRLRAGDAVVRGAQILGNLLRLHHAGAALGERGLLAGLRRELAELTDGVAQPIRLAVCPLDLGAVFFDRHLAGPAFFPKARDRGGVTIDPAISIEQRAVGRGIDESALVVLTVDLHQRRAERAQDLHADRLIVDERAGAAVGKLYAPDDQFVVATKIVIGEDAARRMAFGQVEDGDHLALLGAFTHHRGFAACAERQREGVEQDRFSGAGLARQRGKAPTEIDVEAIDQNDVADGKPSEHWDDGDPGLRRILPIPGSGVSHPLCELARPIFWKALLIQESLFSLGSPPAPFTRLYEFLYQELSGKLWPSTAAAVCASSIRPRET